MKKLVSNRPWMYVGVGLCLGLCVGVGMMIGAITAFSTTPNDIEFPETKLHAMASHGSDQFAMATGPVASDVEGVFFLDYVTGELTCLVVYPRSGRFGAKFSANVVQALGIEQGKTPKYVMVTGAVSFRAQAAGQVRPGDCVVYVADANTGNFVAYGIPWNNNSANQNRPQVGALTQIGVGRARDLDLGN